MTLGSIEGLVVVTLFLLPGGLGLGLRDYLLSSGTLRTPYEEALGALAASIAGLLLVEATATLVEWVISGDLAVGNFALQYLFHEKDLSSGTALAKYVAYGGAAIALPTTATYLRRRRWVSDHLGPISLYHHAFEAGFEELRENSDTPWVIIETEDDRSFRGELRWRSTAPSAPEVILGSVTDVTDSENPREGFGLVIIPNRNLRRVWILEEAANNGDSETSVG